MRKVNKAIKKSAAMFFFLTILTFSVYCADDVRSKPDLYFLKIDEVADSYKYLPPPPEMDSISFLNDKAQYDKGKLLRKTARGAQAYKDAGVTGDGLAQIFSESFGVQISREATPEIYKLLQNMSADAGDLATRSAKEAYMRTRPFAFFSEPTCRPEDEAILSKNGSYPSGHTSIGWAEALVLAEINPARQNEILIRGYEVGESRVICGYHWQSDVDAGRLTAAAVEARLHADLKFQKQLSKAKKEFSKINAKKKN